MYKNMTRKGLAFGAGIALVASGLASVPAQAAGNINDNEVGLVPRTGTEYGMLLSNVLDLKSTVSTGAAVGTANLKWLVTDPDAELLFDYDGDLATETNAFIALAASDLEATTVRSNLKITGAGTSTATIEIRSTAAHGLIVGDVITTAGTVAVSDVALASVAVSGITATASAATDGTAGKKNFTIVDDGDDLFADLQNGDTVTFDSLGTASDFAGGTGGIAGLDGAQVISAVTDTDGNGFADSFVIANVTSDAAATNTATANAGTAVSAARADLLDADAQTALNGTHVLTAVNDGAGTEFIQFVVDDTAANLVNLTGSIGTADITTITITEISQELVLDTYATISAGSLGGGMTNLAIVTRAADKSFVINTTRDAAASETAILRLVSKSTDAHTVTVQAWIDGNGDGLIDGTENASSVRTITFVTTASGAPIVTVDQPISGLATWIGNVSFASTINQSQITASRLALGLGVIEAGALEDASTASAVTGIAFSAEDTLTYNSTANNWRLETGGTSGVPVVANYASGTDDVFRAGFTYVAELVLDGVPQGNRVYKSTSSSLADAVANVSSDRTDNVLKNSSTSYKVRATTTALSVSAKVTKSTVAVVGAPVQVTIARNSLNALSSITAGGKTLTSTTVGGSITFATTTDAAGKAVVAIANSLGKAGDSINVTMTHAGLSSSATTFAWAAPVNAGAEFTRDGNYTGADATDVLAITQGAALSLNYNVFDEFGASPANNHRVLVTYTPIGNLAGVAQLEVVKTTIVSGTSAGFSLTDTSTVLGTYNVVAKLQKLNTATAAYDLGDADTITTTVNVQADITPAIVTVVGTVQGTSALEAEDLEAADIRADKNQDTPAYTDGGRYNVAGSVVNAAGVPIVGAQVLLTAPAGTAFENGNVYTLSTATVTTDSVGAYTVKLFSQKGGKFTVTATAGTATATTVTSLVFPAANTGTGSALTLDIPASAMPGTSFTATATLVDKFGNPVVAVSGANNVLVSVDYTGPGVTVGTLPTSFNASGELKFNVLLGTNDTGTITVVVRYDGDTTSTTNLNDYSVTKSVVVGAPAAAEKVNAGSFLGYVAVYAKGHKGSTISWKIAGKWFKTTITSDYQVFQRKTVAVGMDVNVDIYIDSVKKLSKVVATR